MDINKVIRDGYKKGTPLIEIAKQIGRSKTSVMRRAQAMGLVHPNRDNINKASPLTQEVKVPKQKVTEIIRLEAELLAIKAKESLTSKKYTALLREHNKLTKQYEEANGYSARDIAPVVIKPQHNKTSSEVVPYLVLSDWHAEERVDPRTIGGKNTYDLDTARRRAANVFQGTLKRLREVEDEATVSHMAIFLIGDFITGHLHEENVENAQLGRDDALEFAEELLLGGIQFLLDNTKYPLSFFCKVGNHSRVTEKVRASTEWQNSVEPRMYRSLNRHFARTGRVHFQLEPSYHTTVDILGTKVRYHHGHAVSYGGGVGGLHIPLRKAIKSWNENEHADLDIMGHYHSYRDNSTLRYVVNGSLIGYNAYAERVKCSLEPPLQAFGVIHKKYGHVRPTPIFAE